MNQLIFLRIYKCPRFVGKVKFYKARWRMGEEELQIHIFLGSAEEGGEQQLHLGSIRPR
jgi:hypothetical protein